MCGSPTTQAGALAPVPRRGRGGRLHAVELGPYGYLPSNPERLRDELGRRQLTLSGATAGTALHRGRDALADAVCQARPVALLREPYLITLPAM